MQVGTPGMLVEISCEPIVGSNILQLSYTCILVPRVIGTRPFLRLLQATIGTSVGTCRTSGVNSVERVATCITDSLRDSIILVPFFLHDQYLVGIVIP